MARFDSDFSLGSERSCRVKHESRTTQERQNWTLHDPGDDGFEFERGLITERSLEGRQEAKKSGVTFGAKPKLTPQDIQNLLKDYVTPGCSKREIAEHYGISKSSVYRLYAENIRSCA